MIEDYLTSTAGFIAVGNRHGTDASTVRKWVAAYRVHGECFIPGAEASQTRVQVLNGDLRKTFCRWFLCMKTQESC